MDDFIAGILILISVVVAVVGVIASTIFIVMIISVQSQSDILQKTGVEVKSNLLSCVAKYDDKWMDCDMALKTGATHIGIKEEK